MKQTDISRQTILELPLVFDDIVEKYAGIIPCPSQEELDNDERLARIWNR